MADLGEDWAIRLFREARFAGYEDEPSIVGFHRDNSGARACVAEYLSAENQRTAWPALEPRVVELQ